MENRENIKAGVKSETANCVKKENKHVDKDLVCEACEVDGIPATAFCVDCQDYLCSDCSSHHCIPRPTKHHKVLSQHEMPKMKASTSLSENCAKHEGETIKFYCRDHRDLGCHICIATMHRKCICVRAITELADNIEKSPIYSEIKKELKETEEWLKAQQKRISEKDQLSRRCNTDVLAQVRKRREDINKQFDKLEQSIMKESAKMFMEDTLKMKDLNASCIAKLDSLEVIKSDLHLLEETKQQKQLFIATVKAALKVREMRSALLRIKADTKIRQFHLLPNALTNSLAVREDSLGQLEIYKSEKDIQADFKTSYEQVGISTLIEMKSTNVVATDYQRCLVVLYNCNFSKKGHLKFSTGPWDMTRTGENTIAVTLPHEKKIKFLYIDEKIQEVGQITAPGFCRGIAEVADNLVVTFSDPAGIKVLSGGGGLIKDIAINTQFLQLKQPAYVAVDEDKNIFVTDPVMNSVVRINLNGCVERVCRSIKRPLRISVYKRMLLVSECDSAVFHYLSPDFKILDSEYNFNKDITGDFSISPGGISFQGIVKVNHEDLGTVPDTGHVKYVNIGKNNGVNTGKDGNKKCIVS